MLIVIRMQDGRHYAGQDAESVVDRMREASVFTASESPADYMRGVSARCRELDGAAIGTGSAAAFLHDLQAAGFLEFVRIH